VNPSLFVIGEVEVVQDDLANGCPDSAETVTLVEHPLECGNPDNVVFASLVKPVRSQPKAHPPMTLRSKEGDITCFDAPRLEELKLKVC
jgi:hypothetical protein